MNTSATDGYTLVELLLAALIGMMLIGLALNLMMSTRQVSVLAVNQANSAESLQLVAATLGDDVRRSSIIDPSLTVPSWAGAASATSAITLRVPPDGACSAEHDVTYYFIPRDSLTASTVSEWLRLPADTRNSARSALVRAAQCGSTVTARLVADYLDTPSFALAKLGSSAFTTAPTSSTGGDATNSVRTSIASAYTDQRGTTRVPATGHLVSIATSRTIDPPSPPTPAP